MCNRCVMDTTASDIKFDQNGQCNYCTDFEKVLNENKLPEDELTRKRQQIINEIKRHGKGKEYDCIVGISGGVDSSYALYLAVKEGLRPLAVHFDNGWNSELAVHNIKNLIEKLGVDLFTYVVDWEEFRDLQLAFFKAHVIDIEILTDNALKTVLYQQARKFKLKYYISGANFRTEGMKMPPNWNHYKLDKKNILNIHKKFGTIKPLTTYPLMGTFDLIKYNYIHRIKRITLLNYYNYVKKEALLTLMKEVGYKPYPYKHYESIFTAFYQGYILPKKFNVDKRKLHLSMHIVTGEMTRNQALKELENPPLPDENEYKIYVIKKLGITEEWLENYIQAPEIPHSAYGSEKDLYDRLIKIKKMFKR